MLYSTWLLGLALLAPPGQETAKKAVEDFKARLKEAATPYEKALIVRGFGGVEPKDPLMVAPLIGALAPTPADLYLYVPTAAAEALGTFRSMPQASKALVSAVEAYRRIPYLHRRLTLAVGKVGHPSALPLFDEALGGSDPALASLALDAIAEMPAGLALEKLFAEYDRMEAGKKKAKDAQKRVIDRCQPEIHDAVKRISAQPYPTFPELRIWWTRSGAEFKRKSEETERERSARPVALSAEKPPLIVELLFNEGGGTTPANSGASGVAFPSAAITPSRPVWDGTTAPNGAPASMEWDKVPGPYGVDLGGGQGLPHLKGLKSFTLAGWIMCTDNKEGPGSKECGAGARVLSWLNPSKLEGVEIVVRGDGSFQVGINEWAENSLLRTKPGRIRVYDTKTTDYGAELFRTWVFFAVTYDSTLPRGQAKIYLGWPGGDVALATEADYDRGAAGSRIASHLTVGHVPPQIRSQAPDRNFRGNIDEIRVYGSARDGSGALPPVDLLRIQAR